MPSSSSTMAAPPSSLGAPHDGHGHGHNHGHGHGDGDASAYGRQSYAYGTRESSPQPGVAAASQSGGGLHFPASGAGAAFGYGGGLGGSGGALSNPPGSRGGRKGGVSVSGLPKAYAQRVLRGLKLRNLPFVVLFVGCLLYFFGALSGVGYVEPSSSLDTPDAPAFQLGRPIVPFLPEDDEAVALARREWEMQVGRKARPKDGEWMRQHRDDRAVRRKPTIALVPPKKEAPSPPPAKKADEPKGQAKGKPLVKKAETEEQAQAQAQKQKVQAVKPVEADKDKGKAKGKAGEKANAGGAGAVADVAGEMEDD